MGTRMRMEYGRDCTVHSSELKPGQVKHLSYNKGKIFVRSLDCDLFVSFHKANSLLCAHFILYDDKMALMLLL